MNWAKHRGFTSRQQALVQLKWASAFFSWETWGSTMYDSCSFSDGTGSTHACRHGCMKIAINKINKWTLFVISCKDLLGTQQWIKQIVRWSLQSCWSDECTTKMGCVWSQQRECSSPMDQWDWRTTPKTTRADAVFDTSNENNVANWRSLRQAHQHCMSMSEAPTTWELAPIWHQLFVNHQRGPRKSNED